MLTIITLSNLVSYIIMVLTIIYIGTYFTNYKRNFHQLLLLNGTTFLSLQITLLDIIQNIQYDTYTLFHVKQFQTIGIYLYILIIHFTCMFILQNYKILTYQIDEKQSLNSLNVNEHLRTININQRWVMMLIIISSNSTVYLLLFGTYSIYKNIIFTSMYTVDSIQKCITILSYVTIITIFILIFFIIRKNRLYLITFIMFIIYLILLYELYNTGQLQYVILYSISNVIVSLLYLFSINSVIKKLHKFFTTTGNI